MISMEKYVFLAAIFLTGFIFQTSAQITNPDFSSTEGWTSFEEPISSCDGVCTTDDELTAELRNNKAYIDTGSTGYCGVAGLQQEVEVPVDAEELVFTAKAYQDYWGQSTGVKIGGEYAKEFNADTYKTWERDTYRVDISEYQGQTVKIELVAEDQSQEYCDMGDHDTSLSVDVIRFSGTDQTEQYPDSVSIDFSPSNVSEGEAYSVDVEAFKDGNSIEYYNARALLYVDGELMSNNSIDLPIDFSDTFTRNYDKEGPRKFVIKAYTPEGTVSDSDSFNVVEENQTELYPDEVSVEVSKDEVVLGENLRVTAEAFKDGELISYEDARALIYRDGELAENGSLSLPYSDTSTASGSDFEEKEIVQFVLKANTPSGVVQDSDSFTTVGNTNSASDLSELDRVLDSEDIVVYGDYRDKYGEMAQRAAESFDGRTVSDSSFYPEMKQNNDLVLIGSPSINPLTEELASEGRAWSQEDWSNRENTARLNLVKDAFSQGSDAVIISGYTDSDMKTGLNFFEGIMSGENKEKVEGEDKITISSQKHEKSASIGEVSFKQKVPEGEAARFNVEVDNPSQEPFEGNLAFTYRAQTYHTKSFKVEIGPETTKKRVYNLKLSKAAAAHVPVESGNEVPFNLTLSKKESENAYTRIDRRKGFTVEVVEPKNKKNIETVSLRKGWNMVSASGLQLTDLTGQCEIDSFKGNKLWGYKGEWTHHTEYSSGLGVYVKSAEDCNAEVEVSSDHSEPSAQDLEAGWNLVSVPRRMSLEEAGGNCEFEEFNGASVWYYSPNKDWSKFKVSDRKINPEKGFFVKAKNDCSLDFEQEETPPSPTGNFFEGTSGWLK
jgi:hypothetical protein